MEAKNKRKILRFLLFFKNKSFIFIMFKGRLKKITVFLYSMLIKIEFIAFAFTFVYV